MRPEWHLELMHGKPIQELALGSYGRHIWPSDRHKTVINLGRRVLHRLYTLEFTIIFSLPPLEVSVLLKLELQTASGLSTQNTTCKTPVVYFGVQL